MGLPKYSTVKNISFLLLITGSVIFFSIYYNNHLYQREQLQIFQITPGYLLSNLSVQGGFSIWLGEFFTQFFGIPVAGAVIITCLLATLQVVTRKLMDRMTGKSQFATWSLLPSIGYFFLLTDGYYYLSGLIGLILSLSASLLYFNHKNLRKNIIPGILFTVIIYWMTGAAYLVFVINIVIFSLLFDGDPEKKERWLSATINSIVFLLVAVTIPLIARRLLITDTLLQSFVSEAYYAGRIFFPAPLVAVLAMVPVLLITLKLVPVRPGSGLSRTADYVSVVLACTLVFAGFMLFVDFKEEKEIAYENMVYKGQWDRIIRSAEKDQPVSRPAIAAVNLALAETGQLPAGMFRFAQGKDGLFLDYVRRGMTPFIASESYFNLGLVNFSQMFAMETIESTVDTKLPVRSVKRAAETYILNGQYTIAEKYLDLAYNTILYRHWAKKYLRLIKSGKPVSSDPDLESKSKLMSKYDFYFDYKHMDIALKYLLISNPDNRMASQYLVAFYLLNRDFDGLLQNLPLLKKLYGNNIPVVCQQAIAYILTRLPQGSPELQSMITDKNVITGLQSYAELFSKAAGDTLMMKRQFGDTYWFYLHYR